MPRTSVNYPDGVTLSATILGCGLMVAALVMMCVWATSTNIDKGYLGGLNWRDKAPFFLSDPVCRHHNTICIICDRFSTGIPFSCSPALCVQ